MNHRLWSTITRQPTVARRFVQIFASVPASGIKVIADALEPLNSSKKSQHIYLRKLLLLDAVEDGFDTIPGQPIDRKSVFESLRLLKDPNLVTYDEFSF
jgi:hypothetical protein